MGAENFQYITEFTSDCYIKKQLYSLQQKIDEVKNSQRNGQTVNRRWLKQKLLNEASKIFNVILEMHDEKGICKCSKARSMHDFVKNEDEKNFQLMLDYLHQLNGFLWQLDTEAMVEKPILTKKPLNPLSKCFIPKYLSITENPEFQSDNLPVILKDINNNSALQKNSAEKQLLSQKQIFSNEVNVICGESYPISNLTYNLNFKNVIPEIDVNISTAAISHKVDCYDKLLKYQNEIKALWNTSKNDVKSSKVNKLPTDPLDKFVSNWSVNLEDKKLLNPRILFKPCGCPPCFGYNVPPHFWGNPFNLKSSCSEKEIHLSCYESNCKQIQNIPPRIEIPQTPEFMVETTVNFSESEKFREFRLNKHKKDFQRFVSDVVCDITKVLNKSDSSENSTLMDQKLNSQQSSVYHTDMLQGSLSYLGSIDKHDILNGFSRCARLGQRYQKYPPLIRQLCNTPCSVWCDVKDKTWGWNKVANDLKKAQSTLDENNSKFKNGTSSNLKILNINVSDEMYETSNNLEKIKITRDDDVDSGYDSSTICSASSFNTRNDGSLDLESEFWTSLPDCISDRNEDPIGKLEKLGNRKLIKGQKSRNKNFKIQTNLWNRSRD